ncbi:MAG TPA: Mth938-like domain-containing protein [Burkholderiales bacterium]|nr:Mth938-like domain-containing protein [Burkholderiales bacterium]
MKLHLDPATAKNAITGYGDGYVMVNRQRFERSLVVLPDRILLDWPPNRFDDLAPEHLAELAGLDREIILLGTGAQLRFPRPEIIQPLMRSGVGVEVMDMQAACRTYNILLAEDRRVAAALLIG